MNGVCVTCNGLATCPGCSHLSHHDHWDRLQNPCVSLNRTKKQLAEAEWMNVNACIFIIIVICHLFILLSLWDFWAVLNRFDLLWLHVFWLKFNIVWLHYYNRPPCIQNFSLWLLTGLGQQTDVQPCSRETQTHNHEPVCCCYKAITVYQSYLTASYGDMISENKYWGKNYL